MDPGPADVGCARFPGLAPAQLYRDPLPILTAADAFDRRDRITLVDRRPGADNGPLGAGVSVLPAAELAFLLEYVGPPLAADDARPRQSRLVRRAEGEDDCLYLVVAFRRLLLCARRPGEPPPPADVTLPGGRLGTVIGVYPTWPRRYRVRLAGPPSDFRSEFDRYVTVPADAI